MPKRYGPPKRVYFILDPVNNAVKIGVSSSPEKRLLEIQWFNASPLRLLGSIRGDQPAEKALHRRFRALRVRPRCEWFRFEGELVEHLRDAGIITEASRA